MKKKKKKFRSQFLSGSRAATGVVRCRKPCFAFISMDSFFDDWPNVSTIHNLVFFVFFFVSGRERRGKLNIHYGQRTERVVIGVCRNSAVKKCDTRAFSPTIVLSYCTGFVRGF